MTEFAFESALTLAKKISSKEIKSLDLVEYFIARIEKYNPLINAVVCERFEQAREEAKRADLAVKANKALGCFHGVPITVKESFNVVGLPTTFGLVSMADNFPAEDAIAIARLKKAGAIILAKTNVPINLSDYQSYNEVYGCTDNPWDITRTPGGSSGGSGAALAAGFGALELGSDIGGSVRSPAHYCGVFSHKPTWGIIPMQGQSMPGNQVDFDMSVIGPVAKTAADLNAALMVMKGPYDFQALGLRFDLAKPTKKLKDYKIAIWSDDAAAPVAQSVKKALDKVHRVLKDQGVTVNISARPDFTGIEHKKVFEFLVWSVMGSRLSEPEYEAIKQEVAGLKSDDESDYAITQRAKIASFRAHRLINNERQHIRRVWHRFFQQYDVLILPVMATEAFCHQHQPFAQRFIDVDGDHRDYLEQIFWCGLANCSYLPATVIPTGLSDNGLPVGVQIMGPEFADLITLDVAEKLEACGFVYSPPPHFC